MMRNIVRLMILLGLAILMYLVAGLFVPQIAQIVVLSPKKKYLLVFFSAGLLLVGGFLKDRMDN